MGTKKVDQFSIRQVIELTGISEFTLRGWENRYNAFTPKRSDTGRRAYTQEDLLKIKYLQHLLQDGFKISDIAKLKTSELEKLVSSPEVDLPLVSSSKNKSASKSIQSIISFSLKSDWSAVEKQFFKSIECYQEKEFLFAFTLPLLSEINRKVDNKTLSVAQEHILSAFIKESLYSIRHKHRLSRPSKMRIAFATPEGDQHELGILIASTLAALRGKTFLYLGPNMPREQLCETLIHYKATHILIASTIDAKSELKEDLHTTINFMQRQLPPTTKILLAGRATTKLALKEDSHLVKVSNFEELDKMLCQE